ncbi:Glycosyl hydrolase catalytic domain-containing protein [Desulfonema limicola]|uniref:Glycosyl hydrolase catalytic domain-containing protein n=1 Tax=Desulfonema limicola TaxID=45656 RepID=A0A975BB27_9BACT|nr:alpha-amylase family glycosyl hydrolase [Desulfonema limicola]QTA82037.1 Glycosyl hydrolase catalytic domain-containing protein [Desulfonema limicola]
MDLPEWIFVEAAKSLRRLLPKIETAYLIEIQAITDAWQEFKIRLEQKWASLFADLYQLYGWQYDFFFTLEQILTIMAKNWIQRHDDLKKLDAEREASPGWFLSQEMVGEVLYVDLFSDNLSKLEEFIPYFRKLGLTYLHLMPLFAVPYGDNDGGYAVSDYRAVNPDIGTMEDLVRLSRVLRKEGISLVLDFVFNHTSQDHEWAQKARIGDPDFQAFYHTFPDRTLPDQYQEHLRDIFPTVRRGSFSWNNDMQRWVWTTFNSFQWDLNYSNPEVFCAMAEEMLFLANQGVDVLRLDAVVFIWKRLGTNCENQPEAHVIIRAFNAIARIAAPGMLFKSEAIVAPKEVIKYVAPEKCQLSYNPMLMALLWEALATREVKLLVNAMRSYGEVTEGCSWVNYLRCHDDIGWTFDDEDARKIGIDPGAHRKFLNEFYTGKFEGSFARGVPFQYNPETEDLRISGTLASLAGLEQAVEKQDVHLTEMAVRRINLLRSIMLSISGIPLIYLGDEWGQLNDYTYLSDPKKSSDSRWVHRSKRTFLPGDYGDTLESRFFNEMVKLINLRKKLSAFYNGGMDIIDSGNPHIFAYLRHHGKDRVLVVNNFSEFPQKMEPEYLQAKDIFGNWKNLINDASVSLDNGFFLESYAFAWLL